MGAGPCAHTMTDTTTQTARFEFEKATKNTYRFQEIVGDSGPIIGSLYVQKWVFGDSPPEYVEIDLAAVDVEAVA